MIKINYFIPSLTALCLILSQQATATSAYFYFKDPANAVPVTISFTPSIYPYNRIDSATGIWKTVDLPDQTAVTKTKLGPNDTANKYIYGADAIGAIGVSAAEPVIIKGTDGKVYFEGTSGDFGANIPTGAIWEFIIEKK